jgi:DNA-binding HxlR family transcriptional regulator
MPGLVDAAGHRTVQVDSLLVSCNLRFVGTYGSAGIAALGDPTRRSIFESLARRPQAVGELAAELPVSRPAVSQHLRVLKDAGLVTGRADGTRRIYQIRQQGVQDMHGYLDQMWGQAMAAFQAQAERAANQEPAGRAAARTGGTPGPETTSRARDRGGKPPGLAATAMAGQTTAEGHNHGRLEES